MTQNHLFQKLKNLMHLYQSVFANIKYGFPGKKIKLIAVTGSDGKTTTTFLIRHILQENNINTAFLTTVSAMIGTETIDTGLHVTTPDPWMVPFFLKKMVKAKTEIAVIEATSSGLQQNRLWSQKYEAATITNIGSDHLDYHKTWENYAKAKFVMIKNLKTKGLLVLNKDHDKSAKWLTEKIKKSKKDMDVVWYTKKDVKNLKEAIDGMTFKYLDQDFSVSLIGAYNLENILAAINITKKYLALEEIAKALKTFKAPTGRMEIIHDKPSIIVDFAHTPDALEAALSTLTKIKDKHRKIYTVFGCAGKRDKLRRKMGNVSAKYSDVTILTAEDPRNEALAGINNDILNFAKHDKGILVKRWKNHEEYKAVNIEKIKKAISKTIYDQEKPFFAFDEDTIASRYDAIDFAIRLAGPDDIVFVTGKGHEKSLSFGAGEKEYPWTDQQTILDILASK